MYPYMSKSKTNIRDQEQYTQVMHNLTKCPFCDLKDKYLLLQDDGMALTMNLYPYIDYHLMIIPIRHVENLRDLNDQEFIAIRNLSYVATKLLNKRGIKDINLLYREGDHSDRSLGHLHVHMIPYKNNVITKNPQPLKYKVEESSNKLKKYSEYLQDKLKVIKKRINTGNII